MTDTNTAGGTNMYLTQRLLDKLTIKPSRFKKLLTGNKSTSYVSAVSGVSQRTVQKARKSLREYGSVYPPLSATYNF